MRTISQKFNIRPQLTAFTVVVTFGLCIYLPLLSTNYDLNGMAEAQGVNSGRPVDLFLPNHMLYRPLGYAVRQGLAATGVPVGTVPLLQVLSAIFGALGLGFVYLMLQCLVEKREIAIWISLMLGVSWSYWTMSTDIYYLSLSAMFVAAATTLFVRSQSNLSLAACGVLTGLAILSFQANVFLLPGLGTAILIASPFAAARIAIRRVALFWAMAGVVIGSAFVSVGILAYERRTALELIRWGSSYGGKALPMWGSWSPDRFVTVAGTAFKSILGMELWMFEFFQARLNNGKLPGWVPVLGAAGLAASLVATFRWGPLKRSGETRTAAQLLLLYAFYIPFFIWWDATEPRWFNLSNIFLAGLAAIIASRWSSWSYLKFVLPGAFLILGGLNLATSAWPRRFAVSTPVRIADCVASPMHEKDLFLATEWNWAGYLEYVHNRNVLSFIAEASQTGDKSIASQRIAQAARERQHQGADVYMIDVRSLPPDYMTWLTGQTGFTADDLLVYKGGTAFECVYSPFIRLDPL